MKVALTTPYYPPNIGGVEIHVYSLASKLSVRHDVSVITSRISGRTSRTSGVEGNVNVVDVPCLQIPYSPVPLRFPEIESDVYHSHVPSPFFAMEVAKRNMHPHVVTYHNDVVVPEKVGGYRIPKPIGNCIEGVNRRLVRDVLENSDAIIATTRDYARTSEVLRDFDVAVVPNGIDYKAFHPGPPAGDRERLVLYTGRIVAYKGLGVLIEAMSEIDDAKLVVVGDGEDRVRFEKLARRKGVDALFRGRVGEDEKKMWMRKCRVLVLPSLNRLEAFGIVLLEAMASATPVVASNLPGVREVARYGGYVFEDVGDLVEKLGFLLDNDRKATEIGRRGRKNAKLFDWDLVVEKVEKIYESVV